MTSNDIGSIRHDCSFHPHRAEPSIPSLCDEVEELRDKLAELRITCQAFAQCLLSVRKHNTDEWMDYAAGAFNDLCDVLGDGDRFQYDGRDGLRKMRAGDQR